MQWGPGTAIVRRTVWQGGVFGAQPMTVVSDSGGLLASHLAIGTEWFGPTFASRETVMDELREGKLGFGMRTWERNDVLVLARPFEPYSIHGFWNEEGSFVAWYVNLQEPMRRTRLGYDTRDQVLDIIVGEDLSSWMWKDEHELESAVEMGMHTADEAVEIRRNGEDVIAMIERGEAWWADWRDWAPDSSRPIPRLQEGWDEL
jgi:hypothetical protein